MATNEQTPTVTVTYGDDVLTSITGGESATLHTANTLLENDIVVNATYEAYTPTVTGNPVEITNAVAAPVQGLKAYIPYNNVGVDSLSLTVHGKNLTKKDDKNSQYVLQPIIHAGSAFVISFTALEDAASIEFYPQRRDGVSVQYRTENVIKGRRYTYIVNKTGSDVLSFKLYNHYSKVTDVQVEIGEEATNYEPYISNTYLITLPETSYGGYVDFVNKQYIATYNIDGALEHPTVYSINTPEVTTLSDKTYMYTDVDSLEVKYIADTAIGEIVENVYENVCTKIENDIAKLGGHVTPEMFGAIGDGIADDSDALQNTIDYCIANDVPLIGSGKYLFSQELIIDNNSVSKTPKIRFDGDLTYTGEGFAFLLSGWYISLTLGGYLNCTTGSGIKLWDKDGKCWTAFNRVEFFTITTQGNGIELYAKSNGTYNNEIRGMNLGRFSKSGAEIVYDGACGVKIYRPEADAVADSRPFVSENTLDIRWIHNYHYGQYHGYSENVGVETRLMESNTVLHTSFETNGVGIALVNAHATVYSPRMGELFKNLYAYYFDGNWSISGDPNMDIHNTKFGDHIVPSNGIIIRRGYGTIALTYNGTRCITKGGIYVPYGCRQAWAFNLDESSIMKTGYLTGNNLVYMPVEYVDKDPTDVLKTTENIEVYEKPARNFYLSTGRTGDIVLSRMFYNYYNINSVEITIEGNYPEDKYIYYGDGTLLLTIPKDSVWGNKATIKWESGGSDEAAFTPTVDKNW